MKKLFSILIAVVLAMAIIVPAFAQAVAVPENPETWLSEQVFEAPTCNPMSYGGWVEAEFDPTGGELNHFDLIALPYQTFIVWGSGVSVDETDYGRSIIVLNGGVSGGRWRVVINDGAYRVGIDQWGFFPKYWQPVLACLYGGDFPIIEISEWVAPSGGETISYPEKIETVEVIKEVPVEKIVEVPVETIKEVPVEKIVEVPVEVIKTVVPSWVWWALAIGAGLIAILIWALANKRPSDSDSTPATNPAPSVPVSGEVVALKRKVSSAKSRLTRAQKALTAYTGADQAEKAKLVKAVKTAKTNLSNEEKALKDAENPPTATPAT